MHTATHGPKEAGELGVRTIQPEVLFRELASGRHVLVVDVREAAEVEHSPLRLPYALHVPAQDLFVHRGEIPLARAEMVVAVSNQGVRAREAAFTLSLLGATDVRVLEGGLEAWARRHLPLG